MTQENLFKSILDYNFDGDYQGVDISFEQKLYDSNLGWNQKYIKRTVEEYKKFMYLGAVYKNIAPPDPIDQVWHQHILYTIDYKIFCEKFMGFFLHHNPERYTKPNPNGVDVYSLTLEYYRKEFGQEPPTDIWILNAKAFKRVNMFEHYVVPVNDLKSIIKIFFNELGWRLYVDKWGHVEEENGMTIDHYSIAAFKPAYCWYGK